MHCRRLAGGTIDTTTVIPILMAFRLEPIECCSVLESAEPLQEYRIGGFGWTRERCECVVELRHSGSITHPSRAWPSRAS